MKAKNITTQGFTIVELMIVIAIIGILATIGMVSYSGYQARAKQSSFTATAQQVKLKLGEYFTDNNKYPIASGTNGLDTVCASTTIFPPTTPPSDVYKSFCTTAGPGGTGKEFTYAPLASDGTSCDNTVASEYCTTYTITANANLWGGTPAFDTVNP